MIIESKDIGLVRPLFGEWFARNNGGRYGLEFDLDVLESNLKEMLDNGAVLLVAMEGDEAIGWMAVYEVDSFVGPQKTAMVVFWYASKLGPVMTGPRLADAAVKWAEKAGCSHVMFSASRIASDSHDSICRYCEKVGMEQAETMYLYRV